MVQNLIFGILFSKTLFRTYNVFVFVQTFHLTSPELPFFLISNFLAERLKANKNYQKRSHILQYSFAQKTSLILRTSTHLTLKIVCSRNTAKNLSDFTNFPPNVSVWCQKKIFALHHFLTPKNCILDLKHFESKCLYISIYVFKKNFCFRDAVMFYLVRCWMGLGWIIFWRRLAVWALQNVLQFFVLIEILENSTVF